MSNSIWTPEVVDRALTAYRGGLTIGEVAAHMGDGFTRNMVAGKLHRIGALRGGDSVLASQRHVTQTRSAKARKNWTDPTEATDLPPEDAARSKPFLERAFGRECAWPVGGGMACCGPVLAGTQYCTTHKARASVGKGGRLRGLDTWGKDAGNPDRWFG